MARIDDYRQARELSRKGLSKKDSDLVARLSGAAVIEDNRDLRAISISFLGRELVISWPDMDFAYKDSDEEVPIQQQVLLLHYLDGASSSGGTALTGEWISFQDVPDGRFYMDAFIKRAKDPLLKTFGDNPGKMPRLASKAYDASSMDLGDFSVIVRALPLVPVALILWEGDEEFPPDGNILFDKSIYKILSAEDIAWLAGMVVYPLMGMAKK